MRAITVAVQSMFGVDAVRHPIAMLTIAIDLHAARRKPRLSSLRDARLYSLFHNPSLQRVKKAHGIFRHRAICGIDCDLRRIPDVDAPHDSLRLLTMAITIPGISGERQHTSFLFCSAATIWFGWSYYPLAQELPCPSPKISNFYGACPR